MTSALHAIVDEGDFLAEKPSAAVVHITPEIAERWLARNRRNRPEKPKAQARYARDMVNGKWQITGEAIKIDRNGDIIDGQNRLKAVIMSGVTIATFVVRGLAPEAQDVMDSGQIRSVADQLHMRGVPQAKDVAPAAVALIGWRQGFYNHCMNQSNPQLTKSEVYDFIEDNPELPELVHWVKRVQRELPLPIGALGACAYRFAVIDDIDAGVFYDRIHDLQTSGKGDPIQTLLKRVSDDRLNKRRLWVSTAIYYQVRAWNAFRDSQMITKFQIGSEKGGWATIPEPH